MRARIVTLAFTGRAHNAVTTSCPVPRNQFAISKGYVPIWAALLNTYKMVCLYSSLNSLKRNQGVNFHVLQNCLN